MREAATFPAFLEELAGRYGACTALQADEERYSYQDLVGLSARAAGGLAAAGIGKGDRVALWLPNGPAYMILFLGLAHLGAVGIAVNTRFRAAEVQDIVGRSGAKALVMWPGFKRIDFPAILDQVDPAALTRLETVIVCGGGHQGAILGRQVRTYEEVTSAAPIPAASLAPDTPVKIFTTSGTTKAPKFVLHGHGALTTHARDMARGYGFDQPDAVTLQALPLCGVFGFDQTLASLAGGAPVIMQALFDAEEAGELIRAHRVTHMMGTDDMIARMVAAREEEKPFPSLRMCGFGAFNPALGHFLQEMDRRGVPVAGLYGMSEVQALFSLQRPDDPLDRRGQGGGYPVSPEAKVRVRDTATDELLPPGKSGELEFSAPSLMLRYAENEEATRETMTEDDWLRSGDMGYLRDDGSFVFEARMGDVLRLAGFLSSPAEIENMLERHASVAHAQVIGVNAGGQPRAFAFCIANEGHKIEEATLIAWCRENLANYKVPVRVIGLDAFPVTESANAVKIQRNKLRDRAQEMVDSEATAA